MKISWCVLDHQLFLLLLYKRVDLLILTFNMFRRFNGASKSPFITAMTCKILYEHNVFDKFQILKDYFLKVQYYHIVMLNFQILINQKKTVRVVLFLK